MAIAWHVLRFFWKDEPELRVMGLFGCTHKTIAMGIPLITAIYGNDPNLGQYVLPILIWHPMQLIVGTLLTPRLSNFIIMEKERLGIVDDSCHDKDKNSDGNDDEEAQDTAEASSPDSAEVLVSDNDDDVNGKEDSSSNKANGKLAP
jgi:sodium/bile acid cotransporter 7